MTKSAVRFFYFIAILITKSTDIFQKFQVCLYTIQVPLPKISLFLVDLFASYNKETTKDIAASHMSVLEYCSKSGISILSLGSNSGETEISALCMVQN